MIKGTVSSDTTRKILQLLASDDAFREKMLGDPVAALAEHGVEADPAQVPATRRLPSKQELQEGGDAISKKLEGNLGLIIFIVK